MCAPEHLSGRLIALRSSEAALTQCGAKVLPFGLDLLQTYIFTMYGQASCGIVVAWQLKSREILAALNLLDLVGCLEMFDVWR